MLIKKAVIPVAGLGTRMLPATKAIPKEMLPVVDKPLIQYVIEEAAAAGIREIVLVTHASKNAIENHFDTSFELEAQLEARLKRSLLNEVRSITPAGLTVISVRQAEAKGLGHAILAARPVVGDEPFAVLLPDVLVDNVECDLGRDNLAGMTRRFEASGFSQILVEEVPHSEVDKYGVVDCSGIEIAPGEGAAVKAMVEKPAPEKAPSNMAIVGRYVLSQHVWDLLEETEPGAGGEIQLTDALDQLLKEETVEAYRLIGRSHDCGTKIGYMTANVIYGSRHPDIGEQFTDFLQKFES
ncbi:UTP--glucose-1-phosphate uridylyltransferase GalU [Cellvibrio polysaccharolyticus]|uniref:UTP--glucose-1-phosphate uridylyltransferase n=1 Tax=Cellvibrio polysaccharolyticus TaxID=2082724 RepID=A0A928V799_9GAMM|nr:UTP--glucose-1-phosphate uridylyltransferase GalU [Cellvibrio polysaccharolyticus]MBE8717379.1 UTP--glucose-1-phosphate uridylyltransferase [Cellvibrio polysaccharolyticus]